MCAVLARVQALPQHPGLPGSLAHVTAMLIAALGILALAGAMPRQ